jgi:hypothetical protein
MVGTVSEFAERGHKGGQAGERGWEEAHEMRAREARGSRTRAEGGVGRCGHLEESGNHVERGTVESC